MTDEKICPIMSGGHKIKRTHDTGHYSPTDTMVPYFVPCQREKCMAWENQLRECMAEFDCTKFVESGCDYNMCIGCEHAKDVGYCKLIERRDDT
jgi:hypothetical protein